MNSAYYEVFAKCKDKYNVSISYPVTYMWNIFCIIIN